MKTIRYFIICLMLLVIVLGTAGCGKKPGTPGANKRVAEGGILVYGSLQEPNVLNPYLTDWLASAEVSSLIFSGLVTLNNKMEWIPDLAVDVPTLKNGLVSPDGRTVTYKLRQGVLWHDGHELTAEDVRFTWQMIMNPKVSVVSREGYDKIAAVETPDKYTVVIRFKEYYAPYLALFPAILPQHILGKEADINKAAFNRAPVGTGPFRLKEWQIGDALHLVANGGYHRGKPVLDGITYKIYPDAAIILTQIKEGQVDIASNVNFGQLEHFKAIPHVTVLTTPTMIWEHLDFNFDNPLFQDVRVRQAIALSIDRQGMVNSVLKGVAAVANGDQPPLSWAYNPFIKPYTRDVNRAKALLTEAGWKPGPDGVMTKDGRRLRFTVASTAGNKIRETVEQVIQQQLAEVGIEVIIKNYDTPVFLNEILKLRRFDTALYAWVAGADPDNRSLWHSRNIPSAANRYTGQNYPGWRNPEIDYLTDRGATAVDPEERKQVYFRIQELLNQEFPVIPLYFRGNVDVVHNRVVNYTPNPTPAGNLWNAWQWALREKR